MKKTVTFKIGYLTVHVGVLEVDSICCSCHLFRFHIYLVYVELTFILGDFGVL